MADVQDVVIGFARGGVKRFHPSAVADELGVEVTAAVDALAPLVEDGALELRFEVVCPQCHATVAMVERQDDVPLGQELACYATDEEHSFTVRREDVWITYAMTTKLLSGLLVEEVAADHHGGRPKPWLHQARATLAEILSPGRSTASSRTTYRCS
jgi:hypothetical protein